MRRRAVVSIRIKAKITINFDALGYETAFYWLDMRSVIMIYCITPLYLLVVYSTHSVAQRA